MHQIRVGRFFLLSIYVKHGAYSKNTNFVRISSDKASNLPKRDVRFILLK